MENICYPVPKQEYKVLVRCFTFNHSKYIEEALNGFAMQQTNFPFICLVMDDASTDGEQEVIKMWMERECAMSKAETIEIPTSNVILVPHKTNVSCTFAFYLLKENLYGNVEKKMNHVYPWREKSKYEALCEGDDYWIDPLKLQKQVDFLEVNPKFSMCFHNAKTLDMETKQYINKFKLPLYNRKYGAMDLYNKGWFVPTASIVQVIKDIPQDLVDWKRKHCSKAGGDILLQLYLATQGPFWYIAEEMSIYRFKVPGSATLTVYRKRHLAHKHYLKLLAYTNIKLFRYRYTISILYRYIKYFIKHVLIYKE